MRRLLQCIFGLCVLSPISIASSNFEALCRSRDKLSEGTRRTVNVLLEAANTLDCKKAVQRLGEFSFLSLADSEITDLKPLSVLVNVERLDLRSNNIESLWGVDALSSLKVLIIGNNKIKDLSPLSLLEELEIVDFSNNNVSHLLPLKHLRNLFRVNYSGNPVYGDEDETQLFNGLLYFRSLQRFGFDHDYPEEEDLVGWLAFLESSAERQDLETCYLILQQPQVLLYAEDRNFHHVDKKVAKVILAYKYKNSKLSGCFFIKSAI